MTARPFDALGLDAGSTTTKLVAVDEAGQIARYMLEPTDPHLCVQVTRMLESMDKENALPLFATGYGRNLIDRAQRKATEITCHARGVFRRTGNAGTLIDIGGQDSKVIVIGADGNVVNFAMNDKCAAGTGRFIEVTAARLGLSLDDFAAEALAAPQDVPISSTCTVFAESEVVSLIAQGKPRAHIVRGIHRALVRRVVTLVRSAGGRPPMMLSGGVAQSPAIVRFLCEELGCDVTVPEDPQLMGAYGAALMAMTQNTEKKHAQATQTPTARRPRRLQ